MAMMARMRSLAPWFIIAVGGLFVLFMVLSDSRLADMVSNRSNDIGSINGNNISYQEFANLVEQYKTNQVKQTGQDIPESQMETFREQVWDNLISQKLIEDKIKEIGLSVTDQEIIDIIQGPNPPQIITQYFIDSTGNFNRQAYDEAIFNPQNKQAMLQTEEIVRQQLLQQKLTNYLNASIFVSESEIMSQFKDQSIKISADYAFIDAFSIPDTVIKYSDDDLENYYQNNKEEFKIEAQRKIKYVLFPTKASKDDSTGILNNLKAIVDKVKKDTASFKTYVDIYSDNPYSKDTTTLSMLPSILTENISNVKNGDILGPYLTNEGYVVYKLDNSFTTKEELVRASHILIRFEDNEDQAKSKIEEIYSLLISGADFEKIAKEKSQDGTAANGGDLGWFGKGMMVPEFEKAVFSGKINVIQKPIKTQFGYHIIKVTGKDNKKYVVEKIVNSITPSATTLDRIYENANDFAYLADKNDFEEEANLMNYKIQETGFFREDSKVIPGLGANNSLLKFTFENKINKVSSVFKVPAGYLVASISEIVKPGYKPFEEVKEIIKRKVINNLKLEEARKIAVKIKDYVNANGELSKSNEVYPLARVSSVNSFSPSGIIPGLGKDVAFGQAALNADLNKISEPVKSTRGYYLLKVTERSNFDSTMYSIQKNSIRDNLLNQKKAQVFTDWITSLKKEAKIVDNRHLFYR